MPAVRELHARAEHLSMDPAFFSPLKDKPLHLAFQLTR
jgi:hypothetical protein